jgi:hypothetical protein
MWRKNHQKNLVIHIVHYKFSGNMAVMSIVDKKFPQTSMSDIVSNDFVALLDRGPFEM